MKVKPVLIVGVLLIALGLITSIKPKHSVKILDLERPTPSVLDIVSPIASVVTNPDDKAKMALFNYEFAQRVTKYEIDVQKLNDLYVMAASKFFKETLANKYDDLDSKIVKLISLTTTEDNHILSEAEKTELSTNFTGLSWALINK